MTDDLVKRLRAAVSDEEASLRTIDAVDEAADAIERKDAALRVALEYLEKHKDRMHDKGVTPRHLTDAAIAKITEALK